VRGGPGKRKEVIEVQWVPGGSIQPRDEAPGGYNNKGRGVGNALEEDKRNGDSHSMPTRNLL